MKLPNDFVVKMRELLQEEAEPFLRSYEQDKAQGLRINRLKLTRDEFIQTQPFTIHPIPWVQDGFYYSHEDRPGKHPYHDAGLYYIQEPSAMGVGELVDPKPGEKVLDLCAAPGGKTTHLAQKMNQAGLLVANEIHPARAKILSQNLERMGVRNAVVTNETPDRLAKKFPSFFDVILVDAPCSGEGMFRKDVDARSEWSLEHVAFCAARQMDIIEEAAKMLKPGGRIVYSTCTFSPEENEGVIDAFVKQHANFDIEHVAAYEGFSRGREDWVKDASPSIEATYRLWPHRLQGEGHYIAVLRKVDGSEQGKLDASRDHVDKKLLQDYMSFAKASLTDTPMGDFTLFGDQLYLLPSDMLSLRQLKVVRPGWHLGTLKKNRFEPSHALALTLTNDQARQQWNLDVESPEVLAYLKGETLHVDGPKGWTLVTVNGFSLGWGKATQNQLKNHYPKGLRWTGIYSNFVQTPIGEYKHE